MTDSPWQRRIQRAHELAQEYPFAAEILGFYIHVLRFQEELHRDLSRRFAKVLPASDRRELNEGELSELLGKFDSFLALAEAYGPAQTVQTSRGLRERGKSFWAALLKDIWWAHSPSDAAGFLAFAHLQPYAELLRPSNSSQLGQQTDALCPVCRCKPGLGVLRQMGEGAARSLVCSFCLAEWNFRRLVCPACGEENDRQLPIFTAEQFPYIRVECCETCKTYLKTIDLTTNGRAEPPVDELAAVPLDLWAQERGYAKLQRNILGM
jgi:FdhE protein